MLLKLLEKLKLLSTPVKKEKVFVENFFDYSAREKKKVIKKATEGANKKQKALINGYDFAFYKKMGR